MAYSAYATTDIDSYEGVCRCCMTTCRVKYMLRTYYWMDEPEVYAHMLMDCYSVNINSFKHLTEGICEFCILRLRDADAFRKQVFSVGEALLQKTVLPESDGLHDYPTIYVTNVKQENVLNTTDDDWSAADVSWAEVKLEPQEYVEPPASIIEEDLKDFNSISEPTTSRKTKKTPSEKFKQIISQIKNSKKYQILFPIKWNRANYVCSLCEKDMTNFHVFTNHLNVHSYESIKKVYHNLRKAAKFHHRDGKVKCRRCSMTMNSLEDVKEHMFVLHNDKCLKAAPTLKEKIKLLNREKNEKPLDVYPMKWRKICFICMVCDVHLLDMDEVKEHISFHTPNEIRQKFDRIGRPRKLLFKAPNLRCRTCNAVLDDFKDIKAHISQEHYEKVISRRPKSLISLL